MKLIINILLITATIFSHSIDIFSTAEIHGALKFGEVTKSTGINGVKAVLSDRDKNDIVVDGGGFMAGGIYDALARDYRSDSIRSVEIWQSMAATNYSAITLGDDDLQFSSSFIKELNNKWPLPLVSANVSVESLKIDKAKQFIINRDTIYVTGLTTTENIYIRDKSITISDPIIALRNLTDSLKDKKIILLAHLSPKIIKEVANNFPTVKLIIRAHKTSSEKRIGNTIITPFGFEGSSVAVTSFSNGKFYSENYIATAKGDIKDRVTLSSTRLDLYIMSGCPYGIDALKSAVKVKNRLSDVELNVWFIGDKIERDGKVELIPSLKSGSLHDEMICVAVKELFGKFYDSFIWLITENSFSPDSAVSELRLDKKKIHKWIKTYGSNRIATHYTRAKVLTVDASPTLFINNHLYDGGGRYGDLIFDICGNLGSSDSSCSSIGECYYDYQCPTDSFVGICKKENEIGHCIKLKEDSVTLFVITPDSFSSNELETLKEQFTPIFPSLNYKKIPISSEQAITLMDGLPPILPKLLFDKKLNTLHNFNRIAPSLREWREYYEITDSSFAGNYYYKRDSIPGISVFVDVDDDALVDILVFSKKDSFKILPKIPVRPTKKQLSLLNSWIKEEGTNGTIDNYQSRQIIDSSRFHIFMDNRWFYVANSVKELKTVINWLKEER